MERDKRCYLPLETVSSASHSGTVLVWSVCVLTTSAAASAGITRVLLIFLRAEHATRCPNRGRWRC